MSSKKTSQQRGKELEQRVARWLRSQFGYECKQRDIVNGKIARRPYEVDVHAISKIYLGLSERHVWAECKAYKVKRNQITKLVQDAIDVKDAWKDDIVKWKPDMLMMVSDIDFDVDAIGLADKYNIYCVKAGRRFTFEGKMARQQLKDKELSEY